MVEIGKKCKIMLSPVPVLKYVHMLKNSSKD